MDSLLGMQGRAAVVVGAGQGIGRSAALLLARAGCRLGLVDVEESRAASVARELRDLSCEGHPIGGDVTRESEARAAIGAAVAALGRIDALVDIIGMAGWSPLLEMDEAMWERELRLNLTQHFFVSRAAAQQMIAQGTGGTIVTVASLSGLFAAPRHGAYGAAKAGLVALTKTMAEEWAQHGIRVNTVAPGGVRTPRIEAMRERGDIRRQSPEERAREAEPDDVAGAILFLSSELARKVTGQTLRVDGGTASLSPFPRT